MSTISTSINSSATIILMDFFRKLHKGKSSNRKDMAVLYLSSFLVGAIGVVVGLLMMKIEGVLDAWWKLASIFSGGMLGLFLLGLVCHKVKKSNAVVAVAVGLAVIAWMSFLAPLHTYLTIVLGTAAIFLTGFVLTKLSSKG
jgi:SSS family solute:Na+ symporter